MINLKNSLVFAAFLLLAPIAPCLAASSAASSASDGASTSVGSVSGSIQTSSGSSTKANDIAEGDYKITAVRFLSEQPGMVRLELQGAHHQLYLSLPHEAYKQGKLSQDRFITARKRPYGAEFVSNETRQSFFLVLNDDWHKELQTNAVAL